MSKLQESDPWRVTAWDREVGRWHFIWPRSGGPAEQMAPNIVIGLLGLFAAWQFGTLGAITAPHIGVLAALVIATPVLSRFWVAIRTRFTVDADMAREEADRDADARGSTFNSPS